VAFWSSLSGWLTSLTCMMRSCWTGWDMWSGGCKATVPTYQGRTQEGHRPCTAMGRHL
jgi:hypothetical protein